MVVGAVSFRRGSVSFSGVHNLDFWLDALDVGWGAHVGDNMVSGRCSPQEANLSINVRELLASRLNCSIVCGTTRLPLLTFTIKGALSLLRWAVSFSSSRSAVHHGEEQCPGGRSFQAQSNSVLRMGSEKRSLSGSTETLAGDDRPFCHLVESPMFSIFFALPRSKCLGYGCSSSELGRLSGVCLSTLAPDTTSSEETLLIIWGPYDALCSVVASEALVPGTSGACSGRSSSTSVVSRSAQTASFPSISSGNIQAVSSCVETLQRFARSQGFSSHVAKQIAFARHPYSLAGYQAKWSMYRRWCHSKGHSVSRPNLPIVADFLFWLCRSRKLFFLGYRSMRSLSLSYLRSPPLQCYKILFVLLQ